MSNSGVTTESGEGKICFHLKLDLILMNRFHDGYPLNAEKVNGRWAIVCFVALLVHM